MRAGALARPARLRNILNMKTSDADILFVPGLGGSGPDHWQTRWAGRLSTARLVEQADWLAPRRAEWVETLALAVADCERPVVLVGHSLGSVAIAHAASRFAPGKVKGAMLVAPPDDATMRALADFAGVAEEFALPALEKLPFTSMLAASRNDPLSPISASEALAREWGARFVDAGDSGHINAESGHGPWPEGLMSFAAFLRGL